MGKVEAIILKRFNVIHDAVSKWHNQA